MGSPLPPASIYKCPALPPTPHGGLCCQRSLDKVPAQDLKAPCDMQAIAFAKEYALENGPLVMELDTYR